MHSPAELSPFVHVWSMCLYYVCAHAVLLDRIATILQSTVTGTVSMQPLQDTEMCIVYCWVALSCSCSKDAALWSHKCCDLQGASSTLQQLWDVCKLQSQAVHADSRTAEEVACSWKHNRCLLCTPWWDYILIPAVTTLQCVRQESNITHCVAFKSVLGDSSQASWSQLTWFAWSAVQDQWFKWCSCWELGSPV